jgi:polyphosphate kinase 2 (PPK2 family)
MPRRFAARLPLAGSALSARARTDRIFNRSYYEEVLVVRVHQELLIDEEICDPTSVKHAFWHRRYRSIHNLEQHLHRNGTTIIKFFLHVSRDEQRKRFLARLDDKKKNWKFALSDIEERQHWDQYMQAYEACLQATSTHASPWYIVPADHKDSARLMVSSIILSTLERLKMRYPEMNEEQNRMMLSIRRKLEQSDI